MKWVFVLMAALALGAAACGGGSTPPMQEASATAVIVATPTTDPLELAQQFQKMIASQRALHKLVEADQFGEGEASIESKVSFEKNTGLILDLCSATWELDDREWKAVFDATCSELGPIMIRFKPDRYDGAIQILMNAINNGP